MDRSGGHTIQWQVAVVTRTGGWEGRAAGRVQVSDQVAGVVSTPVILPQFCSPSLWISDASGMPAFDTVESRLDPGPHSLLLGGQLKVSEPSTSDTSSGCSDHDCLAICPLTEPLLSSRQSHPQVVEDFCS